MRTVRITGGVLSDRGLRREINEDAFAFVPELALFLVADGMGGHAAGEVASQTAVATIAAKLDELREEAGVVPLCDASGRTSLGARKLVLAVEHANAEIFRMAGADPRQHGMGTTVAALHFSEGFANLCHVGDSRIYRLRVGEIEPLTVDHAVTAHILTRALGTEPSVEVSWRIESAAPGDRFLLCTDGVHGVVGDEEILDVVDRHGGDFPGACSELIAIANGRGGRDNSTALLVIVE